MSEGLNKVMLLGNLGAEPELRALANGAVLKMRLATTETYLDRNKERQERTDWHDVAMFGNRAEGLGRILTKGERLFVEGRISTSSYEDREGNKRYRTEVIATNVILAGSKGESARDSPDRRGSPPRHIPQEVQEDDFPF